MRSLTPAPKKINLMIKVKDVWTGATRIIFLVVVLCGSLGNVQTQIIGPQLVPPGVEVPYILFENTSTCHGEITGLTLIPENAGSIAIINENAFTVTFNCESTAVLIAHEQGGCLPLGVIVQSSELDAYPIIGPTEICSNELATYTTTEVPGASTYEWEVDNELFTTTTPAFSTNWSTPGNKTITVTPVHPSACAASTESFTTYVRGAPNGAVTITGPTMLCGGTTAIYEVTTVPNAQTYEWELTAAGATIISVSPDRTSVGVQFAEYAESGAIKVKAVNECGDGVFSEKAIVVNTKPRPTQPIWGPGEVCLGSSTIRYYTEEISNAASYNWEIVGEGQIISGNGSNEIYVNWLSPGQKMVKVTPLNSQCGNGDTQLLEVWVRPNDLLASTVATYDYEALLVGSSQMLYLNTCETTSDCVDREIETAELRVVLNTGEDYEYGRNVFSDEVTIELVAWGGLGDNANEVFRQNIKLTIDPSAPEQLFYQDITDLHSQIQRIEVNVLDFTSDQVTYNDLQLIVSCAEEYKYDVYSLDPLITSIGIVPSIPGTNQQTFNWASCIAYENYEFQLLRLYNQDSANDVDPTVINATVDWSKALTIETQSGLTSITLSIMEGTGYYVFRVRPIGDFYPGGIANNLNWGAWSTTPGFEQNAEVELSFGSGPSPYDFLLYYNQFDEEINFIYSRFFAEEGKVKETITYANGLLQSRQEQVHLETTDEIIVSQTVMDFSGRPALHSLPVPIANKISLGYESLFLKNSFGGLYTADNFDDDTSEPQPGDIGNYLDPAPVADTFAEAYGYYSDNNPDQRVASAEGYPFARTLFYRNGINPIKEVSAAGDTHRIKSTGDVHTQRTYYSGVADAELIRVFGDEAPADSSVQKVISVDANNVASVSYINKAGQTIATCLAINGDNPLMDPLPSQEVAGFTVTDNIDGEISSGNNGWQSLQTVTFLEETSVALDYAISGSVVEDLCLNYCATCDYQITLKVQRIDALLPVVNVTHDLPPNLCNYTVGWDTTIQVRLQPGTYTFSKTVTTNNYPDQNYASPYLTTHLDSLEDSYDDFLAEQLSSVYNYLENGDLIGLYNELGIDVNVPYAEQVFQDSIAYIPIGCDSIPIPIEVCPGYVCPPESEAFANYFLEYWGSDSLAVDFVPDSAGNWKFTAFQYSSQRLDTLVSSMLADGYDCDALWDCWVGVVSSYGGMLALAEQVGDYEYNMVDEFLNCTGRKVRGYSQTPYGTTGYLTMAYAYFRYAQGTEPDCEAYVCGSPACVPANDAEWERLYDCVTNVVPEDIEVDAEGATVIATDNCETVCDYRRQSFEEAIVRMYHNDSLYVENDSLQLVLEPLLGNTYLPIGEPLPYSFPYVISNEELQCMVDALVKRCKEGCKLTTFLNPETGAIDSIGTAAEIEAMTQTMSQSFELSFTDNDGVCEEGWDLISIDNYGTLYHEVNEFDDLPQLWDSIYGGNGTDILLDAKETQDGGLILVGYSDSPVSGNKTDPAANPFISRDYWAIKVNQDGLPEWDVDIEADTIDNLNSVIQTSDGGYLLGGTSLSGLGLEKTVDQIGRKDYWLVKLTGEGNVSWQRTYGEGGYDELFDVEETEDGGFLLSGISIPDTSGWGSIDAWIIKTGPQGDLEWDKLLGTKREDLLPNIVKTTDNRYFLLGSSNGPKNPIGGKFHVGYGGFDMWIVEIDESGNILDGSCFGGSEDEVASDLVAVQDGGFAIVGCSNSEQNTGIKSALSFGWFDYWLVKVDDNFDLLWDRSYGGRFDEGTGNFDLGRFGVYGVPNRGFISDLFPLPTIEQVSNRNLIIGGVSASSTEALLSPTKQDRGYSKTHFWLVLVDEQGNYLDDKAWGGEGASAGNITHGVELISTTEAYFLAGTSNAGASETRSQVPFATNLEDFWLVKLAKPTPESCTFPSFCFRWKEILPISDTLVTVLEPYTCETAGIDAIRSNLYHYSYDFKERQLAAFKQKYQERCSAFDDTFTLTYSLGYHHYTLYYYDRAGNLVRTVPPEGVNLLNTADPDVQNREVPTSHDLVTDYSYNSLQQLLRQNTPDGNETHFYYNQIGQLRFSRNARQQEDGTYAYMKYDALGRIVEIGEGSDEVDNLMSYIEQINFPEVNVWERTLTFYTDPSDITYLDTGVYPQRYLQNRVSSNCYDEDGNLDTPEDQVTTYYSYDPHGNVEWLAQELPYLGRCFIAYNYDLVSGNVLEVRYNEGQRDQFFHRYGYDADNRITTVETSTDGQIWDEDATYSYYAHGPLSRMTLGEDKLQGIDYTYTILGWLKGINHASLQASNDPGADNTVNRYAPDAFGMQLNYFRGDFQRSGSPFSVGVVTALNPAENHDLYNGNISTWTSQTVPNPAGLDLQYEQLTGNQYRYDELNRIKRADFKYYDQNGWQATEDYNTSYTYDANGNILSLNRNGYGAQALEMDRMRYNYLPETNQLSHVDDPVATTNYTEDIDEQAPNNYAYDAIGQLTKDEQEEIAEIEWTAYGKVKAIRRTPGSTRPGLRFYYDAAGNRIRKEVIKDINNPMANTATHYLRDASGNIMAIYEQQNNATSTGYEATYALTEHPIYGSDRLGMRQDSLAVARVAFDDTGDFLNDLPLVERITEDQVLVLPVLDIINENSPIVPSIYIGGYVDLDVTTPTVAAADEFALLFPGQQGTNVSRAEDRDGNLLFTTYTPSSNNCIVRSADGSIISAGHALLSDKNGHSLSMPAPGNNQLHYLFTVSTEGQLYYHIIDRTGTAASPQGEMLVVNHLLDEQTGYGKSMVLIDDQTGIASGQLYVRRQLNDTHAEILRYEINENGIGGPHVMTTYPSSPEDDAGIQIAAQGDRLAVSSRKRLGTSMFDGRIFIYTLTADHTEMELQESISLGMFSAATSFDFSPAGNALYYHRYYSTSFSQRGLYTYSFITDQHTKLSNEQGVVRRGYNGNMYYVLPDSKDILEITAPDSNQPTLQTTAALVEAMPTATTGGVQLQEHRILPLNNSDSLYYTRRVDRKLYELKDHLGNVRLTLSDLKQSMLDATTSQPLPSHFGVNVSSTAHFYPFGMGMVEREFDRGYRFGFQGQEGDDEVKGRGNSINYKFRMHDTRLGRFFSVDPLISKYPNYSPYMFSGNKTISSIELEGLEDIRFQRMIDDIQEPILQMSKHERSSYYVLGINTDPRISLGIRGGTKIFFGILGVTGSGLYMAGTDGLGAPLGGLVAFQYSLLKMTVGIGELASAFRPIDDIPSYVMDSESTFQSILGNYGHRNEKVRRIGIGMDFTSGLLTGDGTSVVRTFRAIRNVSSMKSPVINTMKVYQNAKTTISAYDAYYNNKPQKKYNEEEAPIPIYQPQRKANEEEAPIPIYIGDPNG